MSEFLAMGGYGAYVWSAYAIALVLLAGLFAHSRRAARQGEAELERLRTTVRPQRPRAGGSPRPLRPRREVRPAGPPVGGSG